jgi:adenylate kinase family enzyme
MRVVVVGTSGSGKTVMAKRIATGLDLRFIELDRLHWEPSWEALTVTNPDRLSAGWTRPHLAMHGCAMETMVWSEI